MRKFLKLLILSLVSLCSAQAQIFNIPSDTLYQGCQPDTTALFLFGDSLASNAYTYDTLPYYTIPTGGTSVAMNDDQVLGPFPVGFAVSWFCGNYTNFYLCSNGWIGFQPTTAAFTPQPIPNVAANVPKNAIMSVWRDWHPGIAGGPYITYQTLGVAPNRKLVVTWSAVPMFSCTSTYGTFQIVVHETSNIIHMNITNMPVCMGWAGGDGVQGVHDPTGTLGFPVAGRNDTPFTTSNESLRFIPTSPVTWTYPNGTLIGIGNELYTSVTQSTYINAMGVQCDGDTVYDSVYVQSSCINLIVDSVDVDCTGDSTGMIIFEDTSSVLNAPYNLYFLNQLTGDTVQTMITSNVKDTLFNMPAGSYQVISSSGSGFAVGNTIINEPDTVDGYLTMSAVLCNGDSTGKVFAIDTNNYQGLDWDGTYSFFWSDGSSKIGSLVNSDTLENLPIGVYSVTVDGCLVQTKSITVTEPTPLLAAIVNQTKTSCPGFNFCDASANASSLGGVAPYSYAWSTGETTQMAETLCPGSNFLTITDANGCETDTGTIILVPDSIITTGFGDTLICITNPALVTATSIGGTSPFSYYWSIDSLFGDSVGNAQNTLVYPIVDKRYFVSSTDGNGCAGDTASVYIRVRPELNVDIPYLDTICPYDNITVLIEGVGGDSIYTYSWSSGQFGSPVSLSPDLPTWYYFTVSDQCGTPPHADSVFVQVGGYSDIQARIDLTDDSICVGESVVLTAIGRGGFKGPVEYEFEWSRASWNDNSIQTVKPLQTADYVITITDLCISKPGIDTVTIYVGDKVYPEFGANPITSCKESEITLFVEDFRNLYSYNWQLGDENEIRSASNDTVSHFYNSAGCYDVSLEVITDFGCQSNQKIECLIEILPSPVAQFSNDPIRPTNREPIVLFKNESINGYSFNWIIDSIPVSTSGQFHYEFTDTGSYEVKLITTAENGCIDTISKFLVNHLEPVLYFPSSFTPNGDGLNDLWRIVGEGIQTEGFELEIFNRWGNSLFYTQDPEEGWNGFDKTTGKFLTVGSYAYIVRFIDEFNEPKVKTGQIIITGTGDKIGL